MAVRNSTRNRGSVSSARRRMEAIQLHTHTHTQRETETDTHAHQPSSCSLLLLYSLSIVSNTRLRTLLLHHPIQRNIFAQIIRKQHRIKGLTGSTR